MIMTEAAKCYGLWAVLTAPVDEYEAKVQYRAVTGREPDRIHQGPNGWWFMGWLDRDEAAMWRRRHMEV